ncbi:non-specific serine/threonine protein kinase [Ranunculus cassubicifolius]
MRIPHLAKWVFLIFLNLSFLILNTIADPRIAIANLTCGAEKTTPQKIIPSFVQQMEGISKIVDKQGWGTFEYGSDPRLYSLAQCMNDLSHTDCLLCFTEARTKLPRCIPSLSARVHLDGCFLRWDNYSFYQEATDNQHDASVCNSSAVSNQEYLKSEFTTKVKEMIANVTDTAVKGIAVNGKGFNVAEVKTGAGNVYALAQCWESLNQSGCRTCLNKAAREVNQCLPGKEGRGLNAGCYLRYSTEKFYNEDGLNKGNGGFFNNGAIIATVIAAVAFSMLVTFGACLAYKRIERKKRERISLGRLTSAVSKSNLNFKYETLEKATEFFSPSRKLGQGGAGSVFKGTLTDGRHVAVKRLFFNTRQWVDEFFNEVNLISGIRHKNLVQLLGCSIEGPESLLVYEYVVNKSLDHVLFDKSTAQFLNWQQRLHIIVGTAEGLAYLHGGSQTRIIHRDIKCSNVLLDANMNAKIADFGLARMFAPDKSHLSTGIAGTLGYMAPEYLVRGQLTEKADVYSFGVLVLEIVCGRKNTVFTPESGSVLQNVWTHFKASTLPQAIDPALARNFPEDEASNVLQVGLLCTQASVSMRPSMSQVVQMLTEKDYLIPLPMQPPFLNASVMNPDSTHSISRSSTRAMDTTKSSISSSTSNSTTVEISQTR